MQRSEREVPAWPLGSATSISLSIAIGLIFPFSLCQSPMQETTGAYHGTEDQSRLLTPVVSPTPLHVVGTVGALSESLLWLLCTYHSPFCVPSFRWLGLVGSPATPIQRARSTCSLRPPCSILQTMSGTTKAQVPCLEAGQCQPCHLCTCPASPGPLLISLEVP